MNSQRVGRWVFGVALASFGAGVASGLAIPVAIAAMQPPAATEDPDEIFVRHLEAKYDLRPAQVRSLRMVLASRFQETRRAYMATPDELPPKLEREIATVLSRADQRIRALLDDEQRAQYDRDRKVK